MNENDKIKNISAKRKLRNNNIIRLLLSLLVIAFLNIIGSYVFTRFDLTTEKRYTLSDATKSFIKDLDDVVYFKIYLEGDFPAEFKRLRNATREMLDEFRAYSDNIQYTFINPSEGKDKKSVNDFYKQLRSKGLEPTTLNLNTSDKNAQQIIFPGAIVSYKGRELPMQLLTSQRGVKPDQMLNNSIQSLEYNLANVIRKLSVVHKQKIAFITGHGELNNYELADIIYSLSEYYDVESVEIDGKINSLAKRDTIKKELRNIYEAIIIAKPDSSFSENDKYMIDQFIMRGGKVLWFIDPVFASMDSLQSNAETIGFGLRLNLEDMLFQYGVRINNDLILDLNALPIPVITGETGGQPQQSFYPWYYFPIITPSTKHPVVNNLNALKSEFISSIDTINKKNIRKTILLTTSQYSKPITTPCRISLDMMSKTPDQRFFNQPYQPVAVLLEGIFTSVFDLRIPKEIINDKEKFDFRKQSAENKMLVVSDGDIIRNQLHYSKGYPLPLGYDQYTGQMFGNKDFVLNAVDYLCDASGLISVRSRELKLRLLDMNRINNNRLSIQFINTALPVLIILLFGIIRVILRQRINTKK